jgi:hypothetical protein
MLFEGNRVSGALAFQLAQNSEKVPVLVWRDGTEQEVSLPVYVYENDRAAGNQYTLPRYYVYAGLVFVPLSMDYIRTLGSTPMDAPPELLYELFYRRHEDPKGARSEPVVLASVLADAANANVATAGRLLVDKVNGVRIDRLEDVIRALEKNDGRFDKIEFVPHGYFESLDRSEVAKANGRILKNYSIASDRRL